jgi:hypothetical protein
MMKANKSYEDFVRNTDKHMGKTFRSVSEANRDAQYACAIQTFKSDAKLAMDFIAHAIYGFWVVGLTLLVPFLLFVWLTR